MKKDESYKVNSVKDNCNNVKSRGKNDFNKIQTGKSASPKPFLGCNTCKLKNGVPTKKPNKSNENGQLIIKKNLDQGHEGKKTKIKLTDLCEEDKRRIVELMEELTRFAEKNRSLKESLDLSEKAKQEQQECLMKQTNLHLEEKNIFLKEIQTYKSRLESYENEMKERLTKWESREKFMDSEIRYLAKTLQKSFNEKTELMKEISHLKICLKQSLESFELLRNEVSTLQRISIQSGRSLSNSRSQIGSQEGGKRNDESEEDYLSTGTKDNPSNKSSLDVINTKLEQLYDLLQNRAVYPEKCVYVKGKDSVEELKPSKSDIETGTLTDYGTTIEQMSLEDQKNQNTITRSEISNREDFEEVTRRLDETRLRRSYDLYEEKSPELERILRKIEKPFNIECVQKFEIKKMKDNYRGESVNFRKEAYNVGFGNGNYNRESKAVIDPKSDEDRLLSDLFYSDGNVDLGLESAFFLTSNGLDVYS